MAITESRVRTLAQLRVFGPGQGDPTISDHGLLWYDVLRDTWQSGSISISGRNQELEYLDGVGLVCRPVLALQDTRLTQFSTSGGAWEERRPGTGSPRKYRLVQYSAAADVAWSAISTYALPANPHVAFSIVPIDTPPDHDATTYPPYVRIELANTYALEVSQSEGARLLRMQASGSWQAVMDIPAPGSIAQAVDERVYYVRVMRDQLCVSADLGKTYVRYQPGDGTAVSIPGGTVTFRGQGQAAVLGVHQLQYTEGVFTSRSIDRFESETPATAVISSRSATPTGTSITLADASPAAPTRYAAYSATLSPATSGTVPFAVHSTPELYAVRFRYPVSVVAGSGLGYYTQPFDGDIESISISKPFELDGATCDVRIRRDQTDTWAGSFRWSKCLLLLGELRDDDTTATSNAFIGYIRDPQPSQSEYGKPGVTIRIENATARLKQKPWPLWTAPFGGMLLNDALEAILETDGISGSYLRTNWHSSGETILLPSGFPEDPAYLPRPGERKWETAARICQDNGLELGITDDGVWYTVPRNYTAPYVAWVFDAAISNGYLTQSIQASQTTYNAGDAVTAAWVYSTDDAGQLIVGYGIDSQAEENASSPRFCEIGRISHLRELPGTSSLGQVATAAQADFTEHTAVKEECTLTVPFLTSLGRRDVVAIKNCTPTGQPDGSLWVVLSIEINAGPLIVEGSARFGLRRIL